MNILEKTQIIRKENCKVQISEIQDGHNSICHVSCTGKSRKNKWQQTFRSVYGGYAMLMEKHLIDLPGKRFLVYQINEHSKGAHYEYEIYLLDLQGKVLNQFSGGYYSKFLIDDKYMWFLVSGEKPFSFRTDRDLKLLKQNYNTGKVKQCIKLNYPNLLSCSYSYVLGIELTIKHNKGVLQIKYSDKTNDIRNKRIVLTNI